MQAIRVHAYGGPEVLTVEQVEPPAPGPGEVLVQLEAVGVNFIEIYQRMGRYPVPLPYTPGSEGAGSVVAIGPDVESVAVGDRVASVDLMGAYAQYALVRAQRAVPVPPAVSLEVAAGAMLQGMTAHYLLMDSYPVRSGDTILVHAAAGGMGLLLTQLATRLGARVIGTASSPAKQELARRAGADEVIGYADVPDRVRELTDGQGVAAVYDGVGADTFDGGLASLRMRGTMVLFGQASGPVLPVDPQRLNAGGSLTLTRPSLVHFVSTPTELAQRAGDLFEWIADGSVHIEINHRYPLAEAAQAHRDMADRKTTGKILLLP